MTKRYNITRVPSGENRSASGLRGSSDVVDHNIIINRIISYYRVFYTADACAARNEWPSVNVFIDVDTFIPAVYILQRCPQ